MKNKKLEFLKDLKSLIEKHDVEIDIDDCSWTVDFDFKDGGFVDLQIGYDTIENINKAIERLENE